MRRRLTPEEIAEPDCEVLAAFFDGLRAFSNEEIAGWHQRTRTAFHKVLLKLQNEGFGNFPCRCSRCRDGKKCLIRKETRGKKRKRTHREPGPEEAGTEEEESA